MSTRFVRWFWRIVSRWIHVLHDCRIDGQPIRHRDPIEWSEVKLNTGHLRLEGTRCDGTRIEAYANRCANGDLVVYNENANTHDPDRHERTMLDHGTGTEWISRHYGPWEPLIESPAQPEVEGQPSLFGDAA